MTATSLYLCYFGLREPLVQTQVLPYIREVRKADVRFVLLTFEPAGQNETQFAKFREELAADGIDWHWLRYHKKFSVLATGYDILRGTVFTWHRIGKGDIDIVHSRVHIPQLMASVARMLSRKKPKLLFDIRGFLPEEYTDAGRWPENGWLYRSVKRVEKWLLNDADGFVVLTEKARDILFPGSGEKGLDIKGRPVQVIPCCVDLDKFKPEPSDTIAATRKEIGATGKFVVAYVGSFGGWYMTHEMMDLFRVAREWRDDAFALVLTQRQPELIETLIRKAGYQTGEFLVKSVAPDEIKRYLSIADVAISFIKACYSKLSSSPTKIAEYLACGLPIIGNRGVGDIDKLINQNGVGALIEGFSTSDYLGAISDINALGDVRNRCRETADREFDLSSIAGEKYRNLYARLLRD